MSVSDVDRGLMALALEQARDSLEDGGVPVGAVLAQGGEVLGGPAAAQRDGGPGAADGQRVLERLDQGVVSLAAGLAASSLGSVGQAVVQWAVNAAIAPVTALAASVLYFALVR